jgi:hypothetical protein
MPHDLAATRRVRKGLLPSASGVEARTDGAPPSDAPLTPPVIGDRVVADVRHEIGNYFHKLYYWADFLGESRSGRTGDVTATQLLEDTIRGLEDLVRVTLEYVRPLASTPIRMGAREVADGILRQLEIGLGGRALTVEDGAALEGRAIVVDPGRLSQLLGAIVRRLAQTTDAARPLAVQLAIAPQAAGEALAVRIRGTCGDGPAGTVHSTIAEVEWATAENVARITGGALTLQEADGMQTLELALPFRS